MTTLNREIENVSANFSALFLGGVLPHENVRLRSIYGAQSPSVCNNPARPTHSLDPLVMFSLMKEKITIIYCFLIKKTSTFVQKLLLIRT